MYLIHGRAALRLYRATSGSVKSSCIGEEQSLLSCEQKDRGLRRSLTTWRGQDARERCERGTFGGHFCPGYLDVENPERFAPRHVCSISSAPYRKFPGLITRPPLFIIDYTLRDPNLCCSLLFAGKARHGSTSFWYPITQRLDEATDLWLLLGSFTSLTAF